jgi:hypothetical protein
MVQMFDIADEQIALAVPGREVTVTVMHVAHRREVYE